MKFDDLKRKDRVFINLKYIAEDKDIEYEI